MEVRRNWSTKTCRVQSAETKTKIKQRKRQKQNKDRNKDKTKEKDRDRDKYRDKNIKRGTHLSSLPRFAAVESLEAKVISRFPC